eukprot:560093-Heterocapsa_arctica.AAC.1
MGRVDDDLEHGRLDASHAAGVLVWEWCVVGCEGEARAILLPVLVAGLDAEGEGHGAFFWDSGGDAVAT